tara:strand:+ start:787 stop:1374 length:588 start_codon:yes stop_codon:yes gene_type:complete
MDFLRHRKKKEYVEVSDLGSRIENLTDYYDAYPKAKNNELQKSLDQNIKLFESKLNIFDEITVYWVGTKQGKRSDAIAEYFHSSSLNSTPVFILYEDTLQKELEHEKEMGYDMEIDRTIGTTIFHELGHAIVDIDNCYIFGNNNILNFEDEEDYVEEFCRDFYDRKIVPQEMIKLSKKFKKRQWVGIDPDYEINY